MFTPNVADVFTYDHSQPENVTVSDLRRVLAMGPMKGSTDW
jgi:hypothetical protein